MPHKTTTMTLICIIALYSITTFSVFAQDLKNNQKIELLKNEAFIRPKNALTYKPTLQSLFNINFMASSVVLDIVKDNYKTSKKPQYKLSSLPEINIRLQQEGQDIYPETTAFHRSDHPHWEWQISKGNIWQDKRLNTLKIALPFALQERNANCTHTGYLLLIKNLDSQDQNWQGSFQISAETCAYLQFNLAGRLKVKEHNSEAIVVKKNVEKVHNVQDLLSRFPQLKLKKLLPKNPYSNSVSGLVIKGEHYRLSCQNRMGEDPFCNQLVLPSYSTAKSIYAGLALMRLEKIFPKISQVAVSKIIPECDGKQWQNVSLADLLNMRTGNYLSKKPHVDESSSRMLDFFLATTNVQKLELACNMFKHHSPAGKYHVYHSSDTYLAGVMMNKLFQKFTNQTDLYQNLMLEDLWKNLDLSELLATSKRTYDSDNQTFTGWGLSYYVSDLIQIVEWIQQQAQQPTLLDEQILNSAMQKGGDRINREGGQANMAYNFGFWGLEVGHSLGCKKPKWLPFMSGFGGITVVLYSKDISYYSFADDGKYLWLPVVKALNKQFPLCED